MEKEKEIISIDLDDSDSNESTAENSNTCEENENSEGSSNPSGNEKIAKAIKDLTLKDHMKFMGNFDPELSNRERRKLTRKFYAEGGRKNGTMYDDSGILIGLDRDLCDCLIETCPGCHFPCGKCRSCKCGHDCRVNRRWMYELIENEGEKTVTRNPFQNPG